MKIAKIKTQQPFDSYSWRSLGVLSYGESNDFPQQVDELVKASKTAYACLDINKSFLSGMGFTEPNIGSIVVNSKGLTLKKLKRLIDSDFAKYNGVALHVNYNRLFKVRSLSYVPFDNVRLGLPNDDSEITRIAVHPDWGQRDKYRAARLRAFANDLEWYDLFNPDPEAIEAQVLAAGGWDYYRGQVLYYSGEDEAEVCYPVPLFIATLTDMRTEEGLSNVTGRNVCSNFMLSGILADIMEAEQSEAQIEEKQRELMKFQGDEQALQLWYMQIKSKEEAPLFIPFVSENYDKAFTATQSYIPDVIGQAFKQPPILRAKDVGANFGADLMVNAYKFYNSVTVAQRTKVTELLEEVFAHWWADLGTISFETKVLVYNAGASVAERVGNVLMSQILSIISDTSLSLVQRRNLLKYAYGLYDNEILSILPNELANT